MLLLVLLLVVGSALLFRAAMPRHHRGLVEHHAQREGLPESLVFAVIHTESGFRTQVVSRAGARGLMQVTPDTGAFLAARLGLEDFHPDMLFDPGVNIRMGTYYLRYLLDLFGDRDTALAAYNAGPTRVRSWLEDPGITEEGRLANIPFAETRNYLEKVRLRERLYRFGYAPANFLESLAARLVP